MKKLLFICLASIALSACGSDKNDKEAAATDPKVTKVTGNTVAEMTKEGPNVSTRQAKDAWFVHRITSMVEGDLGIYCHVNGEFENKGDVALYQAQVLYLPLLKKDAVANIAEGTNATAYFAPEYGKPSLDPFLPGQTRPIVFKMYDSCVKFEGMKLIGFLANAVNPDGTVKYRAVKDGAPALIIDNKTDFNVVRDES